ncbi:MAG: inorganic phosphate transporter [Bacteroidales bacterium]|nr:inorganic phosphate transporter [Bacteroidales bacterium]
MLALVIISALMAYGFTFLNGMNDAANCIATVITTKALSPRKAVAWAACWQFAAAFIFPLTVAGTMGKGIVNADLVTPSVIFCALLGAIIWIYLCTRFGLPISASHALIGGLVGPIWFGFGASNIMASGLVPILLFIILAPLMGAIMGFLFYCIILFVFRKKKRLSVEGGFKKAQLITSAAFSLGFGGNDGQKTVGVVALLFSSFLAANPDHWISSFFKAGSVAGAASPGGLFVPYWLLYSSYAIIVLGTVIGGRKVIKTLGEGLTKVTPPQGFCSELSGAITLIVTALFGIPVSTTHTITGSIIGTGLTRGTGNVRWVTAKSIVGAWVLTIPATIAVSGLVYLAFTAVFGA